MNNQRDEYLKQHIETTNHGSDTGLPFAMYSYDMIKASVDNADDIHLSLAKSLTEISTYAHNYYINKNADLLESMKLAAEMSVVAIMGEAEEGGYTLSDIQIYRLCSEMHVMDMDTDRPYIIVKHRMRIGTQ